METGSGSDILRQFDAAKDYYEYSTRWEEGAVPPISSLPKNGVVIGDNDFMGFLALTDCDFTIMTWYQFKKESSGKIKHSAFNQYINWCKDVAKKNGKKYLFCFSNKSGIVRVLESHQFCTIEKGHFALEVF